MNQLTYSPIYKPIHIIIKLTNDMNRNKESLLYKRNLNRNTNKERFRGIKIFI